MNERIAIRFKRRQGIYTEGEVAAFEPHIAEKYLRGGMAERVTAKKPEPEKPAVEAGDDESALVGADGDEEPPLARRGRNRMMETSTKEAGRKRSR